jgi:hypothetical protein
MKTPTEEAAESPTSGQVPSVERGARVPLDAVVTHHLDGFRSGVARFNETLSAELGVPLYGLDRLASEICSCPLLSFKVGELGSAQRDVEVFLAQGGRRYEVFLHEYADLSLERQLVAGAQRVHCGNAEVEANVRSLNTAVTLLWSPGHVADVRVFRPSEISVFSFGMAHKVRTDMFRRLRELLERSARSYTVYVSAANHETASLRDAELIFEEMHEIFPETLYFLGNLTDVAVYNHLRQATFFAAFFQGGVRANNSSVSAAMEHGAVVLTNFDDYSPAEYRHMVNVVDVVQCEELPTDPLALTRLSLHAMETARQRDWHALIERLR